MNKQHVKETAISMVREAGLINLSCQSLCQRAGIPDGSWSSIMDCTFTEFVTRLRRMKIDTVIHPVVKTRTDPVLKKQYILQMAVATAVKVGYNKMTRELLAERAGVSEGLITKYFNTMCQLKRDVMRYAVRNSVVEVVAQGLAHGDKHDKKASPELKEAAAALLTE